MDPNLKKQALRLFTYGLYAVMCKDGEDVNGFTANWLTQVSFKPPLLAVSVENASKSLPMILNSGKFTINVLRTGQRDLSATLGKSAVKVPNKLEGIAYDVVDGQWPVLREGLAWVACEVRQHSVTGDSTLVVGEIVDAGVITEGQPLSMAETGFKHAG